MKLLKRTVRSILETSGYSLKRIVPASEASRNRQLDLFRTLVRFRDESSSKGALGSLNTNEFVAYCAIHLSQSHAQLFQDLLPLFLLKEKRGGFFVEFGAADGIFLSNTFLLEKEYGWSGILAEPARTWHSALSNNRKCAIDTRCVSSATGNSVSFSEADEPEFSTRTEFSALDLHAQKRQSAKTYSVETISLNDLLSTHKAPEQFDFLSLDTEGTELEILSSLDFSRFRPTVVAVEHNNQASARDSIFSLLSKNGYIRVFEEVSQWDDWYFCNAT